MIIISEPGVYRLVFSSRKAEAEEFKRWLAHEVLPQLRKTGKFAIPDAPEPYAMPAGDRAVALLNAQVAVLKEARLLFGNARAAPLWATLGLPPIAGVGPDAPPVQSGAKCLAHLLASGDPSRGGASIGHLLEQGFAFEDLHEEVDLARLGLRLQWEEPQGVIVANGYDALLKVFAGTPWANGRWSQALKRLPDARAVGPTRFGAATCRGVFVPAEIIVDAVTAA